MGNRRKYRRRRDGVSERQKYRGIGERDRKEEEGRERVAHLGLDDVYSTNVYGDNTDDVMADIIKRTYGIGKNKE